MKKSLDEWLAHIEAVHSQSWDPGLDRIRAVATKLGSVHPAPLVITVAGTNGKGSTCELLDRLCRAAGKRVGKTTSPHFERFNERIQVDGVPVEDDAIVAAFEQIDATRGDITLTYFEFATLAALMVFQQAAVDVAILEIGLGGRLDAFNIVDPDIAVITRIAMDHEAWLGNTRDAIGAEKAGILRPGIPLVLADHDPPQSILDKAAALNATVHHVTRSPAPLPAGLPLPAPSALAALKAAELAAVELLDTRLPGRWQWLGDEVLLDVAHNPDAASLLRQRLDAECPDRQILAVVGMYGDKDVEAVLGSLLERVDEWFVSSVPEPRAAAPETIFDVLAGLGAGEKASTYVKVSDAYEAALAARTGTGIVLVFGSFPVVAAVLATRTRS